MALTGNDILLPRAQSALVNKDGTATIEFRNFLLRFVQDAGAAGAVTEEQLAALTARVQALEDAALEDMLQGFFSVSVNGNQIYLVGDVASPQGSQYYGTDRDGVRGWYNLIDGFEAGTGLTKTISTDGFNFLGYIDSTSELPPTGALNDAYILNGQYIYWNGTAWANGGSPSNIATLSLAPLPDTGVGTFKCITRDAYGRVEGSRNGTADDVPVAKLGAATYDTLQESINVLNSPGLISGGVLSDGGGGNVAWTAGTVSIRATDSDVSTLYMANFAAGTAAIPNDSMTRFLGVSYNAGTPIVIVKTSDTWDYDTEFPIGEAANLGGTLFPFSNPFKVGDPITNIIQRFDAQAYSIRAASGGLLMSTDGTTRNLDLTAGIIWARLNDFSIAARTSTTFPMYSVRPSGVTPPLIFTPGFTQWPNTQYLSGTTLTTMTNNRWANLWVFVNIGSGAWGFAYGTAQYNNSSGASAEQVPAYLTQNFLRQNLLLGRILFEKNSTVPIIESAFTRVFSTQAVSDHNQLSGLQGGSLGDYQHMTAAQLARVPPAGGTSAQVLRGDGIWSNGILGNFGVGTATPGYIGFTTAISVESPMNIGYEMVSARPDAPGVLLGAFSAWYKTNSAGHNRICEVQFQTDGASSTPNQRGGSLTLWTKPDASTALVRRLELTADGQAVFSSTPRPATDNTIPLGSASNRWSVVYAGTGSINTSDEREKTSVRNFTPSEIEAAIELGKEIGAYKWLSSVAEKGDLARSHIGMTVQRAIEVMQSHGLSPFAYGFICHDSWDSSPEIWEEYPEQRDENGNVTKDASRTLVKQAREAGDIYSFRPDGLHAFIIRGLVESQSRLDSRIAALENKLAPI